MRTFFASEIFYLFYMYDYCELRTTWPPSLVVSVSDYSAGGLGSSPGWAQILECAFFFLFKRIYPQLLHTRYVES